MVGEVRCNPSCLVLVIDSCFAFKMEWVDFCRQFIEYFNLDLLFTLITNSKFSKQSATA